MSWSIEEKAKRLVELERVYANLIKSEKGGMTAEFTHETQALALKYIGAPHREAALKIIRSGLAETVDRARDDMIRQLQKEPMLQEPTP